MLATTAESAPPSAFSISPSSRIYQLSPVQHHLQYLSFHFLYQYPELILLQAYETFMVISEPLWSYRARTLNEITTKAFTYQALLALFGVIYSNSP